MASLRTMRASQAPRLPAPAVRRERIERSHVAFLQHVFRFARVAHDAHGQAIQPLVVTAHDSRERVVIALRSAARKHRVVAGGGDHIGCRECGDGTDGFRFVHGRCRDQLVRELLGDAADQRIGECVDVALHRFPGARLTGHVLRRELLILLHVMSAMRREQALQSRFRKIRIGAAQKLRDLVGIGW